VDTLVVIEIDASAIRPTPMNDHRGRIKSRVKVKSCTGFAWPSLRQFMAGPRVGPSECPVFLKNKDLEWRAPLHSVAAMGDVVQSIGRTDGFQGFSDAGEQSVHASSPQFSQHRLDLGDRHLDRIEVR